MLFALLGPLELNGDAGERVAIAGARQRVLLAALLLHANRPVPADALIELVWDGQPPSASGPMLRSAIRRVRSAVGPGPAARIVARSPGYLIRLEGTELDVSLFDAACRETAAAVRTGAWAQASTAAARALELWRGAPLLDVPSQPLRDQYVPRLEQLRLQAYEDRAEAELHLGHHEQIIPLLRDLIAQHRLREHFHAQLILALYRDGRQSEALAAYQDARTVLVGQLGIEPGPELQSLHHRILTGDAGLFALATPSGSKSASLPVSAGPRELPATVGNFVGRGGELKALSELLIGKAEGGAVLISAINGMAGVGKTALQYFRGSILGESRV